jgi:hypothetical protein
MQTARVMEAVDVLEYGRLDLATVSHDLRQISSALIVLKKVSTAALSMAIALAAHGRLQAIFAHALLGVVRAILAVAVEDAAQRWGSQRDGRLLHPDCQITLHASADGPADHAPRMQVRHRVRNDNRMQRRPSLAAAERCGQRKWNMRCQEPVR